MNPIVTGLSNSSPVRPSLNLTLPVVSIGTPVSYTHLDVYKRQGVDKDGNPISQIVDCTLGRILFNEIILQDLGLSLIHIS